MISWHLDFVSRQEKLTSLSPAVMNVDEYFRQQYFIVSIHNRFLSYLVWLCDAYVSSTNMSLGGVKEFKSLLDGKTKYHDSATGWSNTNKSLVRKTKTKDLVNFCPILWHDLLPGLIDNIEQFNKLKFLIVILSSNFSIIFSITRHVPDAGGSVSNSVATGLRYDW